MVKDHKKLREGLADLFKARGDMTANIKSKTKVNNKSNLYTHEKTSFSENKFKKAKEKNKIKLGPFEGKEPLSTHKTPKKAANGTLTRKNLPKNNQSIKKEEVIKKRNHHSQKSSDDSYEMKTGVGKGKLQTNVPASDLDENRHKIKSQKKSVNKKLKQKTLNGPEANSEVFNGSKEKTKKCSTITKEKEQYLPKDGSNRKRKAKSPQKQLNTRTAKVLKKRKLVQSDVSEKKQLKKNDKVVPSVKMGMWAGEEDSQNESDTTEDYSDDCLFGADSMLESDTESELDDSYEYFNSDEDYEDFIYDTDETDEDIYSDNYSCDDSSSEHEEHIEEDYDSDPDYELPKQEVEDLIVHKGLAVTYNLEAHHGAEFDESMKESHIVELPNQIAVKTVKQHEAYDIERLRSLEIEYCEKKSISKLIPSNKGLNDEDCPQLVPIEDEENDCFKLWTSGVTMDDEMFSDYELIEDSDESSTLSYSDVNRKYLQRSGSYDSSDMEEEVVEKNTPKPMQAFIIDSANENNYQMEKTINFSGTQIQNQESSLSQIIESVNNSSCHEKAKIFKAVIKSFDDQPVEKIQNQQLLFTNNVEGRHKDCYTGEYKEVASTSEEDIFDDSLNSTEVQLNLTKTKDNESSRSDADIVQELNESYDNEVQQGDAQTIYTKNNDNTKRKSRLRTKFYNSIDSYYVLVLLRSPFFIYGTIKAKLVAGSTEIYGYKLKMGETVVLHSPRGCSSMPLKPTKSAKSTNTKEDLEKRITADIEALKDEAEFNPREIKELLTDFDPINDAILLLTRNEAASKIKHIFQQHINENIYPAYIPQSRPLFMSETMLDCMLNQTAEYALQIPSDWSDLCLKRNSKFMLIGGKSVGKSTFLRYLLNKHLSDFPRILLVDLDIGQPEIFVPQTVSCTLLDQPLLGPGFFWQHQPDKAYAVGHTNLVLCAHAYMRAVLNLLEFCKTEPAYREVPWLINTMGYNKGFGCEVISVICAHLQPTDIIQLQSNKPINNFDILFEPSMVVKIPRAIYNKPEYDTDCLMKYQPSHRLHIISSAVLQESRYQKEWQMSAKDMRYIMLLARLSTILPDEGEWLNRSQTFCQSLEKLKIVNLISRNASEIETLKSLECNLVYLCHSDYSIDRDVEDNAPVECLGLGIVRGIDYHDKKIYIIPATPVEKLSNVNCLALGEMPLPGSLLTEQNPETNHKIPFVQVMNDEATSRAVKQFYYRT